MLEHGGNIAEAARRYGIPSEAWLDLSTGINPEAYPLPRLPEYTWHRLPSEDDGLAEVAERYYGAGALAVPGSQAAIYALPRLCRACRVHVLTPTYAEHAAAWRAAGHQVVTLDAQRLGERLDEADVVVLTNPNNPDGHFFPPEQLEQWHARLWARGGWLVVDEAFADAHPEVSLTARCGLPGLVILRSLGKFFGLAGLRVGFVLAPAEIREPLRELLGPWPVSGPGRFGARAALADTGWQNTMRQRLPQAAQRLAALLKDHGLPPESGTALFQWVPTTRADAIAEALAHRAVLVRRFRDPAALRFGLPGTETQWAQLDRALTSLGEKQP